MAGRNVLYSELQQNSRTLWSFWDCCSLPSVCTAKRKWKLLALLKYFSSYVFHSIGQQRDFSIWAKLSLCWWFMWIIPETRSTCTGKRSEKWTVISEGSVIHPLWRLLAGWSRYSLQVEWFLFLIHRKDEVEQNSKRMLLCSIVSAPTALFVLLLSLLSFYLCVD
jgi:hypothetical protein